MAAESKATATCHTRHIRHASPSSASPATNRMRKGVALHRRHQQQHYGKLRLHSGMTMSRRTIAMVYPREKYKYTQGREKPLDPDVADVSSFAFLSTQLFQVFGKHNSKLMLQSSSSSSSLCVSLCVCVALFSLFFAGTGFGERGVDIWGCEYAMAVGPGQRYRMDDTHCRSIGSHSTGEHEQVDGHKGVSSPFSLSASLY